MKYKKGQTVKVFQGSRMVTSFKLNKDVRCLTALRKLVYLEYGELEINSLMLIVE